MDRLRLLYNRLLGRRTVFELRLLDVPVTLTAEAHREIRRARSVAAEEGLLRRVFDALEPGDVVYDVGANIGIIGLLVALNERGTTARVHCFEPEPKNFAALTRNVLANTLSGRVSCHQVALSDVGGEIELFVRGGPGEGRHSTVAKSGSTGSISVPVTTLDTFAEDGGGPPKVLKIDVEGAEGRVLAGASGAVRSRSVRDIFLELHDKGEGDRMPDGRPIEAWLGSHGYRKVWENDRGRSRHLHFR